MEEFDRFIDNYFVQIKTYKANNANTVWDKDVLLQSKFWDKLLDSSLVQASLKDLFSTQTLEERIEYFNFGISCFTCFIECNFTGPPISNNIEEFLLKETFQDTTFTSKLSMNNEEINVNTKHPVLLYVAKMIFECCVVNDFVNWWWCCRALMIHQEILDERSTTLLSDADRYSKLLQNIPLQGTMKAELYIELAQMYLKFSHVSKSKQYLTSASEILGLKYELVGKLGKRTKYQTQEIAQLSLQITLTEQDGISRPVIEDIRIPQNFSLNDEVRLDNITFSENVNCSKLPNIEQKLVLALVRQTLTSTPSEELQNEEVLTFLELLLNQNNTYAVRVMALLLRCRLEAGHRRTIERCLKQYEDIIVHFNDEKPPASNRVGDVFGTSFMPIWKVKESYADTLLNFGLVKNSLDIYLQLQLWEELIVCYTVLKMKKKATEVIKNQLEIRPTVKLMCLLGDATDDTTCYEKAWEMSGHCSHRAQRQWGKYHFYRKQFKECIPHFEKSLSINPLQPNIWLALGFAALQVEKWQVAATAYRRATTLEPDGFEAWNNLAQAYIKLNNKINAHKALLEALRCNFDNWKIWENLLVVSCDIQNYSDAIRAYHRLLDLKEKYLNIKMLAMLVYSIGGDEKNSNGQFLDKTRELMGRVSSVFPNNGNVWGLYADLAPDLLLRAQRLQKAYRCYTQVGWDKDAEKCMDVLLVCEQLAEVALNEEIQPESGLVSSIKLNLVGALAGARKLNWKECQEIAEKVLIQLDLILERIKNTPTISSK